MNRKVSVRQALPAALFAAALLAPHPLRAAEVKVTIDNFTFAPQQIAVKPGDTVTWTNRDDIPHTIVSQNAFRSRALDDGDSYSFTFTQTGSYAYFCSLHPHMTGTVVVEAAK